MTLTEEQREAIRVISKLPMAIGCQLCHPYIMENYGSHFIVLRDMIDSSGTVEPTGGFDLEKARAADEALPYPLDANEIWVSGKGQMHINPPNAPSIFFTLSDLCEFRNLFHGQAAEIERLRAELARVNQLREIEIDQAGASERIYREAARLKDARIKELEDALVEKQTALMPSAPRCYADARRQAAIEQLQAEGKIGNSEHFTDASKMIWHITEERIGLLRYCLDSLLDAPDIEESPGPRHSIEMLRTMLAEAEQCE